MMKKSRLAVLLAVLLALVCAPALATELSSSLDDFQAALSAEEVQAELVYQQLLACDTLKDMHDTMMLAENRDGMYALNEGQLNGVNAHAVNMYANLAKPTADDTDYYELITETAVVIAENNGVVLLATGPSSGSYKLSANTTWNGAITTTGNLTIDLNGYTLTVTGGRFAGISNGHTLTITDTSANKAGKITGSGGSDRGGAIYVFNGGTLKLVAGTITGFSAKKDNDDTSETNKFTDGSAGAVYVNEGGTFIMSGGAITDCSAQGHGGAVFVNADAKKGTFTMTGGTISNCESEEGYGGAVFVDVQGDVVSTFTMTGGSINGNKSLLHGGGVYTLGTFTMDNGTISNNQTTHKNADSNKLDYYGGGVFLNTATARFIMNGGTVSGNTAASGGGVMVWEGSTFEMNGGTIDGNHAVGGGGLGNGGAVYVQSGTFDFNAGTLSNNDAARYGGAVNINQSASLRLNGTVGKCLITGNRANYGGGLSQEQGQCEMTIAKNIEISGNSAVYDGGGVFIEKGVLNISGGTISGNTAGRDGGGVSLRVSRITGDITVNLTAGTISGNTATGNGGGIDIYANKAYGNADDDKNNNGSNDVIVNLTGGFVSGNESVNGGAVHINVNKDNSTANVYIGKDADGPTIQNNKASTNGGAISIDNGSIYMYNGTASINSAANGGMAYVAGGSFIMSNGQVMQNTASVNGGAVYVTGGIFSISGGSVSSNTAVDGGAVYVNNGEVQMMNGSITHNTASGNGGAVYQTSGDFTMQHGIVNNNSAVQGGAVYMGGGAGTTFMMQSGQMNNNTASDDGGAIYAMGGTLYIGLQDCQGSEVNVDKEGNVTITDEKAAAHKELHNCNVADCSHPEITGNEAGDCGGAIAIAKSENGNTAGTVRFYCGNAIGNKAHYKGVGMNVFMDGGDFWYYNGANVGVPREPDLVIVGGKLHNETDGEGAMVNLHYYVSNIVSAEPDMVGLAHPNEWITLPDAEYFWASEKPENTRFFGWTAQGVDSGENSKFVRSTKDYVPSGTSVEVLDAEKNSDDEDQPIWDGNDKDNTIHLYALWAPETSKITYVEKSMDYLSTTANYKETAEYELYNIDSAEQTLTINPTKPGYRVTGWYIYQNENQNANWGYEPVYVENAANNDYENLDYEKLTQAVTKNDDGSLSLTVPLLTFGDITLIAEWEELEAEITYVAVSPSAEIGGWVDGTVNGRITWTQKMGQATGKPANGSALANTPNYKFVGWYSDDKCSALIGNEAVYTPEKVNSLNVSATYYAKFEYDVADLIITATGLSANDSAVFTVVGYNASNQKKTWTISLQNGTAIISDMKIGSEYTITVNDDWSVYYTSAVSQDNQNTIVPVTDENNPNEQTITLTANTDKWLHDESARENWNQ